MPTRHFAALVWHALPRINWCGFYFFDGRELVVGPFQASRPVCALPRSRRLRHRCDDAETQVVQMSRIPRTYRL